MIEVDGTAYPLEPGKTYLLVLSRNAASSDALEKFTVALKERFNIQILAIRVNGTPADVAVKGPFLDNNS